MNAVPMLQACARHQLPPDLHQFALWIGRGRRVVVPTPNLIVRTYRDTGDFVMGADGVDRAVLVIKAG